MNPLSYITYKNSQDICCNKGVYCSCGWVMVGRGPATITSCKCDLHGYYIDKGEVDTKSCWRFVRKKNGISRERQIENTTFNRLTRNWFKIIGAIGIVIASVIAALTYLSQVESCSMPM